jgi:hypothetical protein
MSLSQTPSTLRNEATHAPLDPRLLNLLRHLLDLPSTLPDHPKIYPFACFSLEPHEVEQYGSTQGALIHQLELIFGSRSTGRAVEFRGRGPSLEAIVYVLHKYIDGEDGDNQTLWKWVADLDSAAIKVGKNVSYMLY